MGIPFTLILAATWKSGKNTEVGGMPVMAQAAGSENELKLWNKLPPAAVPPVITEVLPFGVTTELTGNVASGTTCANIWLLV